MFDQTEGERSAEMQSTNDALRLQLATIANRETRLTDLFIDGALDQPTYDERKNVLHKERLGLSEKLKNLSNTATLDGRRKSFLELLNRLKNIAQLGKPDEIRQTVKIAISNLSVCQKSVMIQWSKSVEVLVDLGGVSNCAASLNEFRTGVRSVADRDKSFHIAVFEKRREIYQAVIGDDRLDHLPLGIAATQAARFVAKRISNLQN